MENPTRHTSGNKHHWLAPLLLWLLTLSLWLPSLGNVPLRDWDEGRVATVARSSVTLLPMKWEHDYLNKPPGLHWPMGLLIRQFGEDETRVRLLPALLSSLAVPLIVLLRRGFDNVPSRRGEQVAILAGIVLMTLLPMARHGRLAMLDGSLVSCSLMLWWGWLGAKDQIWRALLAGLACSGILLLKPPAVLGFVLIAAIVGGQRHGPKNWGWITLTAGLLPGISWHVWHWNQRGADALLMWGGQGLARLTSSVGDGHGWWTPWAELLEGGWPWVLLLPGGLIWAWNHRHETVGRWELGLLIGSAVLVLPLRTQLPWYSHLLWPPIALLCAEELSNVLDQRRPRWVVWIWQALGLILLCTGIGLALTHSQALPQSSLLLAGVGLLIGGTGLQSSQRRWRMRGLTTLVLGWCLALLALWQSQLWLWELNESWDPRPLAAEIRTLAPQDQVWLKGPTRPSLGWYAGRELKRIESKDQPERPYWLISDRPPKDCKIQANHLQGSWQLWRCR